jgi:hypothetical protein
MNGAPPIERVIAAVLRLDRGERARLRRGASEAELLLIPAIGGLLGGIERDHLRRRHLLVARIAAILERDGDDHPGTALARAGFHERRMSRLLASDGEVLEGRLRVAAGFLASKRERCQIAPFFRFLDEVAKGAEHRVRAEWARRYGHEKNLQEQRERRRAPDAAVS